MDWTHVSLSRLSSLLLRPEKVRHKISSFEKMFDDHVGCFDKPEICTWLQ